MTKSSLARRERKASGGRIVHWKIKDVAQELAGSFYEWQARQKRYGDNFYKLYPSVDRFIDRDWPNFVKEAKKVLATMLGDPTVSDSEKAEIYDALTKDATMPYSQQEVQVTNFPH